MDMILGTLRLRTVAGRDEVVWSYAQQRSRAVVRVTKKMTDLANIFRPIDLQSPDSWIRWVAKPNLENSRPCVY